MYAARPTDGCDIFDLLSRRAIVNDKAASLVRLLCEDGMSRAAPDTTIREMSLEVQGPLKS